MIQVTIRNAEKVAAFLKSVPVNTKKIAHHSVLVYTMGNKGHGLMHYVPYKHITVKQAGGWKSDKQRRYVMAKIREGKIDPGVPHRTGEMQRAWDIQRMGDQERIINPLGYPNFVMQDEEQTLGHKKRGWRVVSVVVKNNIAGALRYANAEVQKWLNEHGK